MFFRTELQSVIVRIKTTFLYQFVVLSLLNNASILHDEDDVRVPDRRQAMRNHDSCLVLQQPVECFEDELF